MKNYKTRKALDKLMKLAEENILSAEKIAAQIPTEQLNLEYLINCQKSEHDRIRNLAESLLRRLPPEQLSFEYLVNCQKSDSYRIQDAAARLVLSNFPRKISPEYLVRHQGITPKQLVSKVTKRALENYSNQFSLKQLFEINRTSFDPDVQEMAADLALKVPIKEHDVKFLSNLRNTYLQYNAHSKKLAVKLIEKYKKADLNQKEEGFFNRYFS